MQSFHAPYQGDHSHPKIAEYSIQYFKFKIDAITETVKQNITQSNNKKKHKKNETTKSYNKESTNMLIYLIKHP